MEKDLLMIKTLLLQYVGLIEKEYSVSNTSNIKKRISEGNEIVRFNESSSVSFHVRDGILWLPKSVYGIFPLLEKYENYGTKPNNHRKIEDYLDTNTTYYDYINHVIEGGFSVYDYYVESLLHETMHLCGSGGGSPLEEGINELKTRELAQKYNINFAAYGYPKEVEIAKRLQMIFGKELMDELTFIPKERRADYLSSKVNVETGELYKELSNKMIRQSYDYFSNLGQISDPFEKARIYETIDYSEVYSILDKYVKINK